MDDDFFELEIETPLCDVNIEASSTESSSFDVSASTEEAGITVEFEDSSTSDWSIEVDCGVGNDSGGDGGGE